MTSSRPRLPRPFSAAASPRRVVLGRALRGYAVVYCKSGATLWLRTSSGTKGRQGAAPDGELQLIEQPRLQRDVLRPHVVLIIVRDEVADLQMLADREIQVLRVHLEETVGVFLVFLAAEFFGQIRPDAISVEHRAKLFLE